MKTRLIEAAMACILLIGAVFLPPKAAFQNQSQVLSAQETGVTGEAVLPEGGGKSLPEGEIYKVVLDAGHGGRDAGKTGVNGALEKEINLKIVRLLEGELKAAGFEVALTRETDAGLYQETDSNKKMADMRARCAIIEKEQPDIVISIHQNSYHQESVAGPQVFYYTGSESGRFLAEKIQASFLDVVGEEHNRSVKSNSKYYLLLNVRQPAVIVECGFLSNPEEADLLASEDYQQKIARAIRNAAVEYFEEHEAGGNS